MIPTIWQIRQNCKHGKKTRGYQEDGMDRFSIDDFWGSETILHDTIMMNTCCYMFVKIYELCKTKSEP